MTKIFFADSAGLISPRTAKYVEALVREGDDFDYDLWLKRVREEEAQAKQVEATSTSSELAPGEIDHARSNPLLGLVPKTLRVPRAPCRPHRQAKSQTPKARLRRWLEKVRRAWGEFQTSRARDAVYDYLAAVFAVVMHYKVRRRTTRLLRHAFAFAHLPFDKNPDPFSVIIRCTSERDIDNKTISKYARALRYAARRKKPDMRVKAFMQAEGGVNACAARYARYYGRRVRKV